MIDYDKLKIAHELADKATKGTGMRCDVWVSFYNSTGAIYGLTKFQNGSTSYATIRIDDLITKLQEITKAEPKYKVGQEVFVLVDREIRPFEIHEVTRDVELYYIHHWSGGGYLGEDGLFDQYTENEIYPSREALIDAQIEYWNGLKPEKMPITPEDATCVYCGVKLASNGQCGVMNCPKVYAEDCEHESDGCEYFLYHKGKWKCKKCGVFYR